MKCAKCHTIGAGDRVGPDLRGAADRHEREWLVKFIMSPGVFLASDPAAQKLLEKYNGVRMEETHLARADVEGILEYLKAASAGGLSSQAPLAVEEEPMRLKVRMPEEGFSVFWPGLAFLFLLLAAAAALWQFRGHRPAIALLFVCAALAYWTFGGRRYYHLLGNQQGYEPVQPIAFSHARHAGSLGIACLYCHYAAERSDVAAVPAVNVCMNCHGAVRKAFSAKTPSPEIAKLLAVWEKHEASIPWVRVHQLPDYVHFTHRIHVNNNIQCQECHGPVETMERVRQASALSMGWCIACHRLKTGDAPSHWKRASGPLDCAACHW